MAYSVTFSESLCDKTIVIDRICDETSSPPHPTQSKIQIKTVQQVKSTISKVKGGKYAKTQGSTIFRIPENASVLFVVCKRSQHCCATLQRSRNKK